jgi:hypothetical protein
MATVHLSTLTGISATTCNLIANITSLSNSPFTGIRQLNPAYTLDVGGTIRTSSNVSALGAVSGASASFSGGVYTNRISSQLGAYPYTALQLDTGNQNANNPINFVSIWQKQQGGSTGITMQWKDRALHQTTVDSVQQSYGILFVGSDHTHNSISTVGDINSGRNLTATGAVSGASASFSGGVSCGTLMSSGNATVSGNVNIASGVIGLPATTGASQSALVLRLRGSDNAVMDFGVNGENGTWIQSVDRNGLHANYPLMLNPNGGNVGIMTASPLDSLHVNGNIRVQNGSVYPHADNRGSVGGTANRWVAVYAMNGTIQTSDETEKDHTPLQYGLEQINQVSTIKYKWKSQALLADDDPDKLHEYYGVCAREVDKLFPELVYNQNEPYQINYAELIPVLINAVKELDAKLKASVARIDELEASAGVILMDNHTMHDTEEM